MANFREGEEQSRVHVWLFADDLRWVRETFGSTMGVSKPVRMMVRKFRENAEAKARASAKSVRVEELDEVMEK